MFRIQAYNVKLKRIFVYIVDSHAEKMTLVKSLRDNPDYGLIEEEYNPRGSFYR